MRAQLRGPAVDSVTPLVERAHRDGELGADFDAVDVLIALRMLAAVPDAPEIAARVVRWRPPAPNAAPTPTQKSG